MFLSVARPHGIVLNSIKNGQVSLMSIRMRKIMTGKGIHRFLLDALPVFRTPMR